MAQPIDRGAGAPLIQAQGTESSAEAAARHRVGTPPQSIEIADLIRRDRDHMTRFEDREPVCDPFQLFSEWGSDVDTEAYGRL